MVTNPVQPPTSGAPTPPPADAHYDEMSGVYGFFRRHQKKLLYTAGMFVLLTFSISGPMTQFFRDIFGGHRALPSIVVNGKRVDLQQEDFDYGTTLARSVVLPLGVLPQLGAGDDGQTDTSTVLAVLRRAAITEGFGYSMVEVDRAIQTLCELVKADSPAKLARERGFPSLHYYRDLVGEAMRIGTYVKLQTLAVDSTEAHLAAQMTNDREKITLRVASFEEKKAEEDLKKASPLTEEALREWLKGKTERDKHQMQAYDPPRAQLTIGALLTGEGEGQFDPEQWKDSHLKDFTVADDQLKGLYEMEKQARFKVEGKDKEFKPFDDAAVKAELTRIVQAEQVMNKVMELVRARQTEALKPQTDEVAKSQGELGQQQASLGELQQTASAKAGELASKEKELAAKPDDPGLKAEVEALKKASDDAKFAVTQAEEAMVAKKAAVKTAEDALTAARGTFDFAAAFTELTKDKKGAVVKVMTEKKSGEDLKDLEKLGLGLGTWALASQGASLRSKGDLCFAPGRTTKAIILYQATEVEPLPEKPWETLKPLAEGAYWTEQAKKQGEEKKKLMEEALLRLAKEKITDKIAELEGKRQQRIDEMLAEWEKKTQEAIAKAEKTVAETRPGRARNEWQQKLDSEKAQLAAKDAKRTEFEAKVKLAIETEIKDEAKKFYKDVLDAAAAEAGYTVANLGPFPRDISKGGLWPRFDKAFPAPVVFLWRSQSELKEGETTGVLQDFTGRAYYVATCAKVEPLTLADVTRRQYESMRTGDGRASFATQQAFSAYAQAFTMKAIEARYDLKREATEVRQEASTDKKPAEKK